MSLGKLVSEWAGKDHFLLSFEWPTRAASEILPYSDGTTKTARCCEAHCQSAVRLRQVSVFSNCRSLHIPPYKININSLEILMSYPSLEPQDPS